MQANIAFFCPMFHGGKNPICEYCTLFANPQLTLKKAFEGIVRSTMHIERIFGLIWVLAMGHLWFTLGYGYCVLKMILYSTTKVHESL
jgi:hypothetical protein